MIDRLVDHQRQHHLVGRRVENIGCAGAMYRVASAAFLIESADNEHVSVDGDRIAEGIVGLPV